MSDAASGYQYCSNFLFFITMPHEPWSEHLPRCGTPRGCRITSVHLASSVT